MKILTIAATPFFSDRGCHIRIYSEAKYLQKLGAEVRICAYHIGRDIPGLDIARIGKASWYKKTTPGFSWGKVWLDIKLIFLCRREIKKFKPDIIHAHLYEGLGIGYLAKKLAFKKIPIVFDLQGDLQEEFKSYSKKNVFARRFFSLFSRMVINWADWVILSSENALEKIKVAYKKKESISVVRDGIDLDLFKNPPALSAKDHSRISQLRSWKRNKKLLIYIGGLSGSKGVKELLKAFSEVIKGNLEWKLALGGYGDDEEKYQDYIKQNSLEDKIILMGKVSYFSLPHFLAVADAAIDPKQGSAESSGKLANYIAADLPIICFENKFNRARLGEKGFYLRTIGDLKNILASWKKCSVNYNSKGFSEEEEAERLFRIFNSLLK